MNIVISLKTTMLSSGVVDLKPIFSSCELRNRMNLFQVLSGVRSVNKSIIQESKVDLGLFLIFLKVTSFHFAVNLCA